MGNTGAVKSVLRFPDVSEMLNRSHLGDRAFDIFHGIAAFEQVVGCDAFAVFDNVGNFAAPERMRNVVAEICILRGDLVSPAFVIEGLPAPVIVFRIGQPLADGRVVSEADKQLVDKPPSEGLKISA